VAEREPTTKTTSPGNSNTSERTRSWRRIARCSWADAGEGIFDVARGAGAGDGGVVMERAASYCARRTTPTPLSEERQPNHASIADDSSSGAPEGDEGGRINERRTNAHES